MRIETCPRTGNRIRAGVAGLAATSLLLSACTSTVEGEPRPQPGKVIPTCNDKIQASPWSSTPPVIIDLWGEPFARALRTNAEKMENSVVGTVSCNQQISPEAIGFHGLSENIEPIASVQVEIAATGRKVLCVVLSQPGDTSGPYVLCPAA